MKKLLIASVVLLFAGFFISCNNAGTGGMSEKAKKNLDNSHAITKMFESGDFSKVGDYIAADGVDHGTFKGDVKGLDSMKAMFNMYAGMMSDMKIETVKELADDDYVIMWLKQSWTAKVDDPMMHMKAGDHGTMESVEVTKHNADGKITDHWGFMSSGDMMKMMPPPGNMSNMNPHPGDSVNAAKK